MSVDFHVCCSCGGTFVEYSGRSRYCNDDCGNRWCSDDCADSDDYEERKIDSDGNRESSCAYCRGETFTENELLNFAIECLDTSREELIEEYKKTL